MRTQLNPLVRWRLAAGDLAAEPLRTALGVVVLAPLVASWFLLAALGGALVERPTSAPPRTLIVTGPELFDPAVVALGDGDVARAAAAAGPDAESVTPMVVRLVDVEGRTLQLRGADPATWARVHDLELRTGRAPQGNADEVAITASVQTATGWTVGRTIRVFGSDLTVVGVYKASGSKVAALWLTLSRAEALFERPGEYQFLAVHAAAGVDSDALRHRLQAAFDDLLVVDESHLQLEVSTTRRSLGDLARVFTALGFGGLAAGTANATALALAERRRTVGTLRMLGFPASALRGLLTARAMLVTAGSLVIGLAVAIPVVRAQPGFVLHSYPVRARVTWLQGVVGVVSSLIGAWLGAVLAARRVVRQPISSLLAA